MSSSKDSLISTDWFLGKPKASLDLFNDIFFRQRHMLISERLYPGQYYGSKDDANHSKQPVSLI